MKTIEREEISELNIKNSRFITLLYPIKKKEEVDFLLSAAKKNYPKATHYTFAYRIGNIEKSSDDHEPGGTAGIPMLHVLQKQNLTNILVIVIRYFGGIKLGAGGLVRAYSKCVQEALQKVPTVSLIPAKKVKITIPYEKEKELFYLLRNENVLKKEFQEKITIEAVLENPSILKDYSYQIIGEEFIKVKE